jgi:hypothetical protein
VLRLLVQLGRWNLRLRVRHFLYLVSVAFAAWLRPVALITGAPPHLDKWVAPYNYLRCYCQISQQGPRSLSVDSSTERSRTSARQIDVFVLPCTVWHLAGLDPFQRPSIFSTFVATFTFWRLPRRQQHLECVVAMKCDTPKCCVTNSDIPCLITRYTCIYLPCTVPSCYSVRFWGPPRMCRHIKVVSKTVVQPCPNSRPVARGFHWTHYNLFVSTRNVQNIKDIHADEPARRHATLYLIPCVASVERAWF